MPNPKKQDPDTQPANPPSHPYRKDPTKPVGRDSDATPGQEDEPTRTPQRVEPQAEPRPKRDSGTPSGGEVDDPDDLEPVDE